MEPFIEISKDDFMHSGWQEVINESPNKECFDYSMRFRAKALEAAESSNAKAQQVLILLSDITSMRMKLDSPEEPFGPMMVLHGGRTATVDDLEESHLSVLGDVLSDIADSELKARISDVLCFRKPDYRMADLAISSYLESAKALEDPNHWPATVERVERALQLAVKWGRNSGRLAEIVEHIEGVLAKYDGEDPLFLSAKMMQLLQERGVGNTAANAARAEKLARRAEAACEWDRAKEYWEVKANWHFMAKDKEQALVARVLAAETHVRKAEEALRRDPPSYMHAAAFINSAIEALRRVEGTRDRIRELRKTLLEYQEKSTSEMINLSESVPIPGEMIDYAVGRVKEKPLFDALLSLATIYPLPKVSDLRLKAEEYRRKYILRQIFPNVLLNEMGRTVSRQSQSEEGAILEDMYSLASTYRATRVQALIEPARQQILTEHYVRVQDFLPFVSDSPLIKPGREWIIARGLYAGLQGDLLTAVHFLIPQLEDSARYVLSQMGVITSGLDDEGTQDEYNLNRLLSASEYSEPLVRSFGEDLVFDLRGLLVERFGANLRNELAHGLLSNNAFYGVPAYYSWWLSLRFYSLPTVAGLRAKQETDESEGEGLGD
jgi:hypothetical protein